LRSGSCFRLLPSRLFATAYHRHFVQLFFFFSPYLSPPHGEHSTNWFLSPRARVHNGDRGTTAPQTTEVAPTRCCDKRQGCSPLADFAHHWETGLAHAWDNDRCLTKQALRQQWDAPLGLLCPRAKESSDDEYHPHFRVSGKLPDSRCDWSRVLHCVTVARATSGPILRLYWARGVHERWSVCEDNRLVR
jgi:hypothetical protein